MSLIYRPFVCTPYARTTIDSRKKKTHGTQWGSINELCTYHTMFRIMDNTIVPKIPCLTIIFSTSQGVSYCFRRTQ